jgi:hypothetical protein
MPVLVAALVFGGCGSDGDPGGEGEQVSSLVVVNARGGTLEPAGQPDRFTLRLRDIGPLVTAFSDRPERLTFSMTPRTFLSNWDRAFGSDPPNAALDLIRARSKKGEGTGEVVVLELRRPRLTGETASFAARRLDEPSPGLAHYRGRTSLEPPRRFGEVALFIDIFAINYNVLRTMQGMGGLDEGR